MSGPIDGEANNIWKEGMEKFGGLFCSQVFTVM